MRTVELALISSGPVTYKSVVASNREGVYPELWRGLVQGYAPLLGQTGTEIKDVSSFKRHGSLSPFSIGTDWKIGSPGYMTLTGATNHYITFDALLIEAQGSVFVSLAPNFGATDSGVVGAVWGCGQASMQRIELRYEYRNVWGANNAWAVVLPSSDGLYPLYSPPQTFPAKTWNRLAFTWDFDADQYKLYLNGREVDSHTGSETLQYRVNGRWMNSWDDAYGIDAQVSLMLLYNRILKEREIRLLSQRPDALFKSGAFLHLYKPTHGGTENPVKGYVV